MSIEQSLEIQSGPSNERRCGTLWEHQQKNEVWLSARDLRRYQMTGRSPRT